MLAKVAALMISASPAFASEICNICLDTPLPAKELYTGKGGSIDGKGRIQKLDKPLFTGSLFYSLDDAEKVPLPEKKGVFFQIHDRKKHKIKILNESGKSWGTVPFDCDQYDYGSKIFFKPSDFYGPGWLTYPMPKDEKKCRWHPDNVLSK